MWHFAAVERERESFKILKDIEKLPEFIGHHRSPLLPSLLLFLH